MENIKQDCKRLRTKEGNRLSGNVQ